MVEDALLACGISAQVSDCVRSDSLFNSRNKAKMMVGLRGGDFTLGIPTPEYAVADITSCGILLPDIRKLLVYLGPALRRHKISAYSIKKKNGEAEVLFSKAK